MYDEALDFREVSRQVLLSEVNITFHGFEGLFRFVSMTLQKKKKSLLIEELSIVLNFLFLNEFIELSKFFLLIIIMLNLTEEKESSTLFAVFSLLFLF